MAGATSFIQPRVPKNAWKFATLQLNPGPESVLSRQAPALAPGIRPFRDPRIPAPRFRPGRSVPLAWPPRFPGARGSRRRWPGPSGPASGGGARRPGACARTSHSAARGRPLASRGGRPARAPRSRSAPLDPTGVGPAAARRSSGLRRPGTSPGPRCRAAGGQSVRATRGRAQPEPLCARPRRGCSPPPASLRRCEV